MAKKVIESKIDSDDFAKLMEANVIKDIREEIKLVLEGQYKYAYEAMMDAYNAGLFVGLVGPYAESLPMTRKRSFIGLPFLIW